MTRKKNFAHIMITNKVRNTVDENIIATTKIRNNYGAIQSFKFPILQSQSWKSDN